MFVQRGWKPSVLHLHTSDAPSHTQKLKQGELQKTRTIIIGSLSRLSHQHPIPARPGSRNNFRILLQRIGHKGFETLENLSPAHRVRSPIGSEASPRKTRLRYITSGNLRCKTLKSIPKLQARIKGLAKTDLSKGINPLLLPTYRSTVTTLNRFTRANMIAAM